MKMSWMVFKREITPKMYRQVLQFLFSARRLMMLYISMKFQENILKHFLSYRVDTKLPLSNFKGE